MTSISVSRPEKLQGLIHLPGDKSISHRAVMLNAASFGSARVTNFAGGEDCSSSVSILRSLGTTVERIQDKTPGILDIEGVGMHGFSKPSDILDAGNSGTTMRLMSGLLAARSFNTVITGDASLRTRPMSRILEPLRQMGASLSARNGNQFAPLILDGGELHGIDYRLPIASAQVKSCILFAGLRANGETIVRSPSPCRDHSERMLSAMGASIEYDAETALITASELKAIDVDVPGDISSAAFWIVAALVHPNAKIVLNNVGLNPSRTGCITVLREMGGQITLENEHDVAGEPVGDVIASSSSLHGIEIGGNLIPTLIDEIPIMAVAAAMAEGTTRVSDAEELRFKESDRISATAEWLEAAGVVVEEKCDGMTIHGVGRLRGTTCDSYNDHRIAMSQAIGGLISDTPMHIKGGSITSISYPNFWKDLQRISGDTPEVKH